MANLEINVDQPISLPQPSEIFSPPQLMPKAAVGNMGGVVGNGQLLTTKFRVLVTAVEWLPAFQLRYGYLICKIFPPRFPINA